MAARGTEQWMCDVDQVNSQRLTRARAHIFQTPWCTVAISHKAIQINTADGNEMEKKHSLFPASQELSFWFIICSFYMYADFDACYDKKKYSPSITVGSVQ